MATRSHNGAATITRPDAWIVRAISAGFVATVAMTVALLGSYLVVRALGSPQASGLQLWFWALTHNSVVDFTTGSPYLLVALHFCFGIAGAVVYAAWAEPRLTGPGWRRGLVFCLLPWLASLVGFLPLVGGGALGLALGAGPLPILGNLVLHLVYGGVLGELYSRAGRSPLAELEELPEEIVSQVTSMLRAERGAAIGLGGGTIVGVLIGIFIGSIFRPQLVPTMGLAMPLACAIIGAALGALIGSLVGTYLLSAETGTAKGTTNRR